MGASWQKFLVPLVAAIAFAMLPSPALAASGVTTISFGGSGLKSLKSQQVKLSAGKPAELKGSKLTLPNTDGLVGESATVLQGGTLKFKRGKRSTKISGIRLSFGGTSPARVYGRLGGKQITLFTINAKAGSVAVNRVVGAARLTGGTIMMSKSAAKTIRKKLKLLRAPKTRFGSVSTDMLLGANAAVAGTDTRRVGCQAVLTRPGTAVDIISATINWHVKESWVNYLESSATGGAFAIAPAAGGHYDFQMTSATGWYDPISGQASVSTAGGVNFKYPEHGIDIATTNLRAEIDGVCSRATVEYQGQRLGIVDLGSGTAGGSGSTHTFSANSTLSGEAAPIFLGFYEPGEEWGSMSVSVTTP